MFSINFQMPLWQHASRSMGMEGLWIFDFYRQRFKNRVSTHYENRRTE